MSRHPQPLRQPLFFARPLNGWYAVCLDTHGNRDSYYSEVIGRLLYISDALALADKLNELMDTNRFAEVER